MPTDSRSIRGALDAYSTVNSSGNAGLATRMVWEIRNSNILFFQAVYGGPYGLFLGSHLAILKMDDNGTNTTTTSGGGTTYIYDSLVSGHGIDISGPHVGAGQNPNYGNLASYGSLGGNINQGLKHYNDTVQFCKGISIGLAPGILNNANNNFVTGGTNGPAVLESNNTYRTVNIKMSDFRGVRKNDPGGNGTAGSGGYIWNDGNGDEEIVSTGPISVGNAAALSVGGNANGTV